MLIRHRTKLVSRARVRLAPKSEIACDLNAFTPRQKKSHELLSMELLSGCKEVRELRNGYSFTFPGEQGWYLKVARWITLERLCCPFFTFSLGLEPQGGPAWLRITGPRGAKQLLRNYFREETDQVIEISLAPQRHSE